MKRREGGGKAEGIPFSKLLEFSDFGGEEVDLVGLSFTIIFFGFNSF